MTGTGDPTVAALECRGLTVSYGRRAVLRGLDLTVGPAEAVAVLGPSGCGKTTLLYTVAGFVEPGSGTISIAGRVVATGRSVEPPERRGVGVVFQNYALWPHLSAVDTVAYPLRRNGWSRSDARRRALSLLDRMGVAGLADRRPAQLSGGEQQRVGVARALAREAPLYLFDEPTAHLDTSLRIVLQEELAEQRASLGAAVLYATHDVAEAFAVADRVALVRDGSVVQVASPEEIYERPVDLWAAQLTGPAALLHLQAAAAGAASIAVTVADTTVTVAASGQDVPGRGVAAVLVRPEWARLGGELPGRVVSVRFRGADTDYRLDTPAGLVDVRERGAPRARAGEATGWTLDRVWLLDPAVSPTSSQDPSAPLGR